MKAAYCSHKSGEPEVQYIRPGGIRTLQTSSKMRRGETVLVGKLLMPVQAANVDSTVLQQCPSLCIGFGIFTYVCLMLPGLNALYYFGGYHCVLDVDS